MSLRFNANLEIDSGFKIQGALDTNVNNQGNANAQGEVKLLSMATKDNFALLGKKTIVNTKEYESVSEKNDEVKKEPTREQVYYDKEPVQVIENNKPARNPTKHEEPTKKTEERTVVQEKKEPTKEPVEEELREKPVRYKEQHEQKVREEESPMQDREPTYKQTENEYLSVEQPDKKNVYNPDLPACTQKHEDYEELMRKDNRHFCHIYWDYIKNDSTAIGMICSHQFLFPLFNNIYQFCFGIILDFFFNILFFSLEMFRDRIETSAELNYNYTWKYEYPRIICAALVSHAILSLLYPLLFPNRDTRHEYQTAVAAKDPNTFNIVMTKMWWRYLIYYSISIVIMSCFFYLITAHSSVYVMSQWAWLEGGFLSLLWRLVIIELVVCNLNAAFFYWMARKDQKKCCYWTNYKVIVECMVN